MSDDERKPRPRTRTQVGPLLRDELARLHILRGVDIASIEGVIEQCSLRMIAPGEALLQAGEVNQTMYMILDGRLSVHLEGVEQEPVAFVEAGQTVGELSVIDHRPATAFVVAQRLTRLVAVDEEAFWRLVTASHALAKNLLQLLAQRMRASNVSIAENVRLRQRFEHDALAARVVTFEGTTLPPVTISIGVTRARGAEPVAALLQRADAALYRAKDRGRDRVEVG